MNSKRLSGRQIRKIILDKSYQANVGHIGSCLSVVDILAAVYSNFLNIPNPSHRNRDRFILSKGHAALALFATLYLKKVISLRELNTFFKDDSLLGVHPDHGLTGIDFTTGSLGHGLPMGVGAAMAARLQKSKRKTVVLVSDAECNEGSLWEAVMFAAHHRLSNLIVVVDSNQQQAFGYTREIINLSPLAGKWANFGWEVVDVAGHDVGKLEKAFDSFNINNGLPHVIIARTTFGKGVSYMENKIKWHYWPMNKAQYQTALANIKK